MGGGGTYVPDISRLTRGFTSTVILPASNAVTLTRSATLIPFAILCSFASMFASSLVFLILIPPLHPAALNSISVIHSPVGEPLCSPLTIRNLPSKSFDRICIWSPGPSRWLSRHFRFQVFSSMAFASADAPAICWKDTFVLSISSECMSSPLSGVSR